MAENLNSEEEALLHSALSTAFEPAPLPRQSVTPQQPPSAVAAEPSPTAPSSTEPDTTASSSEAQSVEKDWKEEYEFHLAEWKQRSAEQRQKAEEERAKWEAIRAKEKAEGKEPSPLLRSDSGWEALSGSATATASVASPSHVDARDLVSGETEGGHSLEFVEAVHPGEASSRTPPPPDSGTQEHNSEPESSKHEKWDDMASSLTSSYPSMSFPSDPHSPTSSARHDLSDNHAHDHRHRDHHHAHEHDHAHPHSHAHALAHDAASASGTATLSVFDTSLSSKTRALALLSSVAINVLLPFVNGVMLGFGEIFAKNIVVRWLGWKIPGTASAATGRGPGKTVTKVGV
ncbi:hypothetical protein A0H81_07854 [Grifola frondosa]|uniref:Mitochondrial import protein 1 n=1 Tax=Grifola frondosa TaxID=5627 RepID=A0A1C7M7T0_GRIFR|nr:hypothetical protein A0H81_07854 [Grifola frondosa]